MENFREKLDHEPSTLPWFRDQLRNKMAELEQEIAAHRHTLDLLRQTESAYGRFVPHQFLRMMDVESILDVSLGVQTERKMTILFSDIRDFARLSERLSPKETFALINSYLGEMEPVISEHGGIVDKYLGDGILAVFPVGAEKAVQCAICMLKKLEMYNLGRVRAGYVPIRIGMGLNTGVVMLGTIGGIHRMESTVISDAVNTASRLEDVTKMYRTPLLISEHTFYAVSDPSSFCIRFIDRIHVKGKAHPQSVYEVFDNDPPAMRSAKMATRQQFEEALAFYHLKAVDKALPLLNACLREAPDDYVVQFYLDRCQRYLDTGRHEGSGESVTTLEWRDEFLVGVEAIDDQHRELLARINQLAGKIREGDTSGIDETLRFVVDYVHFHFENEEHIMIDLNYPLMSDHLHEHQRFVEHLDKLRGEISSGLHDPLYLGFQIQLFLFDWFVNHTTGTDGHLGRYVRAQSRGSSHA